MRYAKTGADFMYHNSIEALVDTLTTEVIRTNEDSGHAKPKIDVRTDFLLNGLRSCSVQIICAEGCDYNIEAFGDEAESLYQTAVTFKKLLENPASLNAVECYCKFPTSYIEQK